MLAFLALFGCVFMVMFVTVLLLIKLRRPVYTLSRNNVARLFRQVLDGSATENDWLVFIAISIIHDPLIEKIRLLCVDFPVEPHRLANGNKCLFSPRIQQQIQLYLSWLEQEAAN